jgi:hypothetical protein
MSNAILSAEKVLNRGLEGNLSNKERGISIVAGEN